MIGKTILHFKILERLGEGGMGVVYLAEDTRLERKVAIKFLPRYIAGNAEERERFKIEAKAAAALNHPNIATIYSIEEFEQETFIVMEYIDGQELKQKIQSGPTPILKALEITIKIGEGLQAAHEKEIVHRDIKSTNIMLTAKGRVKIMDFGLAKVRGVTQMTKQGTTLGTTTYMSPEQARGEQVDHRTDIWSLGVILYEMISGKLPFHGDYEQAVIYSIFNEDPQPLGSLRTSVPKELQRIVIKALAKDQNERYQHVNEMLVDLKSVSKAIETSGAETSTAAKMPEARKAQFKNKTIFFVGITLIAVMAVTLLFIFLSKKPKMSNEKSIAVLPFKNLSGISENEYFSDGITEDIITQLSKIGELKVIARSSIERHKNSDKSVGEIAEELGVSTVLEGSVRRAGNRVRIGGQLIDAKTEENLWAETYDRQMEDIFDIQSDVSTRIAIALQAKLSPAEKEKIDNKPTDNLDAYNLYLQGRFHWRKRKAEALVQAAKYFERAVELDPLYELAYVGVSDSYALFPYYQAGNLSDAEAYAKAEHMARKALELNPNLAEAYTSLGNVLKEGKWDWSNAEKVFKKALELNPNDANAHQWYCEMLVVLGRMSEALDHAKKAYTIEPFSVIIANNYGRTLLYNRQYDLTIEQLKKSLELDPTLNALHSNLMWSYYFNSMFKEAIAEAELMAVGRYKEMMTAFIESIRNPSEFNQILRRFDTNVEKHKNEPLFASHAAQIYSILGDTEKALLMLEKAYQRRDPNFVEIFWLPNSDNLKAEPRFIALKKKVGIDR